MAAAPMDDLAGSVTRLIPGLQQGDPNAVEELWRRYVARVEGLARPIVGNLPPGAGSADDVAQSAFTAFFSAAQRGQAPALASRDELWRLLATITRNKASDRARRELRVRRGGDAQRDAASPEELSGDVATPSQDASLQELLDSLLADLDATGDPRLRRIAQLRLAGATNDEIAAELACTTRTIQRKLLILERLWNLRNP